MYINIYIIYIYINILYISVVVVECVINYGGEGNPRLLTLDSFVSEMLPGHILRIFVWHFLCIDALHAMIIYSDYLYIGILDSLIIYHLLDHK